MYNQLKSLIPIFIFVFCVCGVQAQGEKPKKEKKGKKEEKPKKQKKDKNSIKDEHKSNNKVVVIDDDIGLSDHLSISKRGRIGVGVVPNVGSEISSCHLLG